MSILRERFLSKYLKRKSTFILYQKKWQRVHSIFNIEFIGLRRISW